MDRSNGISLYYVALRHPEIEPVKTETPRLRWHIYKIQEIAFILKLVKELDLADLRLK